MKSNVVLSALQELFWNILPLRIFHSALCALFPNNYLPASVILPFLNSKLPLAS
nr:MAG TPA: hypothetical protein [Bacteriophage sp.]